MRALSTAENLGKMISDKLWLSRAPADASNLRPLTNSFVGTERQESGKTWGASNSAGEPLPKECFPEEIFGTPDAKDSPTGYPICFLMGISGSFPLRLTTFFGSSIWVAARCTLCGYSRETDKQRSVEIGIA